MSGLEASLLLGSLHSVLLALALRRRVHNRGANRYLAALSLLLLDGYLAASGALAPIVGGARWQVLGGLTMSVRGTRNDLARMTNVGTDVVVLAGRYAPRGFVAAEIGFDWLMATHVAHAAAYRMV